MTDAVRTPDDRFTDLPGFAHAPEYVHWDAHDLRLARVDLGPRDADECVVMLHGEPTWGFLWRDVAAPVVAAGARVVLPDLPGFGRSDKPTDRAWFTYDRLVESLDAHLAAIDDLPASLTLVVHDWGGPIGLRWAVDHLDRLRRLVICDTGLFAPGGTPSPAFVAWQAYVRRAEALPVADIVAGGTATGIDDAVRAAYAAPFHVPEAQAGALALPLLVPTDTDHPSADAMWDAHQRLQSDVDVPTLLLWGAEDEVLPSSIGARWAATIPGAVGLERFSPAGHFLQEDAGPAIGQRIATFVADT